MSRESQVRRSIYREILREHRVGEPTSDELCDELRRRFQTHDLAEPSAGQLDRLGNMIQIAERTTRGSLTDYVRAMPKTFAVAIGSLRSSTTQHSAPPIPRGLPAHHVPKRVNHGQATTNWWNTVWSVSFFPSQPDAQRTVPQSHMVCHESCCCLSLAFVR